MGRMFSFDKQFLFRNDSIVNFDHLPSGSGHHPPLHLLDLPDVVYFSNIPICEIYSFLISSIDTTCNEMTSISNIEQNQNLIVFPNPSEGKFEIKITESISSQIEMSIYNYSGKMIFNQTFSNSNEVLSYKSFPNLSTGNYLFIFKIRIGF